MPVFVVAGLGSIYGEGYWAEAHHPENGRKLRAFYGLATASLALVMAAGDAWSFLAGWEIVTLAAFFLVTTDQNDARALRAGWIYLVSAHVGTLILFAMFALLDGSARDLAPRPVRGAGLLGAPSPRPPPRARGLRPQGGRDPAARLAARTRTPRPRATSRRCCRESS